MQIHELNNFTGTLGSGAYLAIDDGNDTGKISSQGLLAATEARIDNIIAGPAPSAEEIVDARLGDDGVTYPSLGDAIRDQFSDVKSALYDILANANLWKQGLPPSSWSNTTRITTKDFVNDTGFIGITLPTGWYGNLYAWDGDTYLGFYKSDGTWVSSLDSSSYIQATSWFFQDVLEAHPTYDFSFVTRKLDGTSITPSDGAGISLYKSKIDEVDAEIPPIKADIARLEGVNPIDFTFNGTLKSTDDKHSFSYSRPSVAYDDEGNQVANNVPVYNSMKYFGQKGIVAFPATTNLLSASLSQELSEASTLSLSAGDYSVSVGEGEVTISGDAVGKAVPYDYFSFTLAEAGSITVTSTSGTNAKFVQVEKLPYATQWQIGGTARAIGTLTMDNISDITFGEFGVGMIFRPIHRSDGYQNNEEFLIYGYKDSNNYFFVDFIYRTSTRKHFQAYFKIGGNIYAVEAPWNSDKPIYFNEKDVLGFYMHVIPNRGIYLYALKNGIVTPSIKYTNIPALGQIVSLAVGQKTLNDGGRNSADCTIANVRFDIDTKPDAMAYFKEVLEQ